MEHRIKQLMDANPGLGELQAIRWIQGERIVARNRVRPFRERSYQ